MTTDYLDLIESTNIPKSLIHAVVNQVGDWESFTELAPDVTAHGASGGFSGFIYYSDTGAFTERTKTDLIAHCKAQAEEFGMDGAFSFIASFNCLAEISVDEVVEALHGPEDDNRVDVYNALAWYALEEVSRAYVDLLEG